MYVNDSGSPSHTDNTDYFILSGVIVRNEYIKELQRIVFEYKQSNFIHNFIDSEIHTHEIYQSKGNFRSIDLGMKIVLLDGLYEMIDRIDCVAISIIINKSTFSMKKSTEIILDTAWSFLLERYDMFLHEHAVKFGRVVADTSSKSIQNIITNTTNRLINCGSSSRRLSRITHFEFADSAGVYGIQVADAFAYCTLKHKMNHEYFSKYWKNIHGKLRRNDSGIISGYGYKEYPK